MSKLSLKIATCSCSCNNCGAKNYDGLIISDAKRVDIIYELQIGCMVNALCEDCLKKLTNCLRMGIVHGQKGQ